MDKTTITTYAASGAGFLTGLTTNDKLAVMSVGVALLTFFLNWFYKHKHYRLAQKAANIKAQGKG
ncbi:MAG: hypothetical protein JKY47_03705 [Thalassospira sp.]|jgi:hypothetical protein|uniref:HP1 family phage holin n=1 Tax=Thalassospira sp. 11-3 TaxID=2135614 RepID=UPI000D76AB06|nr:HP1 family phage holin [Thalassospira sp. 11-3]MBL4839918.1 hypothetical protein [Thalassospira sp.]PXX30860.1 holin family HP1 protein [Thalassospira sp. 11-3]